MGFDRGKLFSFFFCTEYAVRHFERIVSADSYNTNARWRHRCGHRSNRIIQMKSCHCFQSFLKPLFLGIPVFRSTFFLSFRMALNSSILAENQKRRYPVFYTGTVFLHIFYAFLIVSALQLRGGMARCPRCRSPQIYFPAVQSG